MPRPNFNDLIAFRAVAQQRSFTRAAAQMGLSPSALSHAVRGLEERIGVRLLTRTTRSVSPTQAGERLLATVGPSFDEIEAELAAIGEMRDTPAGTIRITTGVHAAETTLWPVLKRFLADYPDVEVEVSVDAGLVDIAANQFDAGIRMGETLDQDMVAVPIGPDLRMAAVGTPSYFERRPPPVTPDDLAVHNCINLRFPTFGGLYAWEFEKAGRELNVRVDGQLIVNEIAMARQAALDGAGIAYLPEDYVAEDVSDGQLRRVLEDWCPPFSGYHLYYPSRRQQSQAFSLLVDALRYRGG
ncbi:LysR family transcriptional regulator [Pacificimonas flava]|uniref:LysR family transcriptional regulator n=2 Tax=Pacificimonas TaxID=1960290 RepID=A0A219B5B0_9SPHN|nr:MULTISPECIES: LysR family transcriptional regulator [Pacificimonas]MBZ6377311.1 LysR family transcriptional regulator [Pacificimonas aurantium]OWV32979.1 LysR family transcriptional regulator [Pacificimonas flava]